MNHLLWLGRVCTGLVLGLSLGMGTAHSGCLQGPLKGVNLAGAEFGTKKLPGVLGTDYAYPSRDDLAYFRASGMNVIRLPVRWERVQRVLHGPLDAAEVAQIKRVMAWARALGLCVVLDLHNYATYASQPIGSSAVSAQAFEDVWLRLAAAFADADTTALGLMNEPAAMPVPAWLALAQSTVLALRSAGAPHLLLLGSGRWSGAHEFEKLFDGISSAQAFARFTDPLNRYAVELHQYADANFSGTSADCIPPQRLVTTMQALERWSRSSGVRLFMGEFGVGSSEACLADLRALLGPMQDARIWLGWTYWAAGARWGKYPFSIHPAQGAAEAAQLGVLRQFLPPTPSEAK